MRRNQRSQRKPTNAVSTQKGPLGRPWDQTVTYAVIIWRNWWYGRKCRCHYCSCCVQPCWSTSPADLRVVSSSWARFLCARVRGGIWWVITSCPMQPSSTAVLISPCFVSPVDICSVIEETRQQLPSVCHWWEMKLRGRVLIRGNYFHSISTFLTVSLIHH